MHMHIMPTTRRPRRQRGGSSADIYLSSWCCKVCSPSRLLHLGLHRAHALLRLGPDGHASVAARRAAGQVEHRLLDSEQRIPGCVRAKVGVDLGLGLGLGSAFDLRLGLGLRLGVAVNSTLSIAARRLAKLDNGVLRAHLRHHLRRQVASRHRPLFRLQLGLQRRLIRSRRRVHHAHEAAFSFTRFRETPQNLQTKRLAKLGPSAYGFTPLWFLFFFPWDCVY